MGAGSRRRVIEGEGLGGFARRLTINVALAGWFLPPAKFFSPHAKILLAGPPAGWNWPAASTVLSLALFPGRSSLPGQSDKPGQLKTAVTSSRPRNVDLVPIGSKRRLSL
jgi:hypothetical protein